ncbi:MAG: NrfD/PsrC family molybdoenzyme membrane anchor subunit [Candidatus Rokuibacteriota bacterium]
MEPIVLMQEKWSHTVFVPLYLYLGGLTAGTFVVAVVADLVGIRSPRFARLSRIAAFAAVPMLVLAGFFLTAHLGKPERGLAFPIFFTNYNSWMTWGGWIVIVTSVALLAYAALWWFEASPTARRVIGIVGIPLAVGLAMYTGALLAGAMFVPLWNMEYLPLIFLNSGLTTGVAAAGLVAGLVWALAGRSPEDSRTVIAWLSAALVVLIALEILEMYRFMGHLASAPAKAIPSGEFIVPVGGRRAYEYVTQGPLAPWFWWGFVAVGLAIPLALTVPEFLLRRWATPIASVKFALVLVGGFMLRWVIVHGGDLKAPLPFPPSTWPIPMIQSGLGG